MGELLGMLIALPFVMLGDWFGWIAQQRHPEVAKTCHGAGMLALLAYVIWVSGGLVEFAARLAMHAEEFYWVPVAIVAAWGTGWILLNASYAAQSVGRPHRATMTVRALIKLAVGYGIWVLSQGLPLLGPAAAWCLATGATKLLLMVWGKRSEARPLVEGDIAGKEFDWDKGEVP